MPPRRSPLFGGIVSPERAGASQLVVVVETAVLTCRVLWEGLREADQASEADTAHYCDTRRTVSAFFAKIVPHGFGEDLQNTQPEHYHHANFPPQWHLQTPYLAGGKCQHPEIEGYVDDSMRPGHGVDINTAANMLPAVPNSSSANFEFFSLTTARVERHCITACREPALEMEDDNVLPHIPEVAHGLTLGEINYHVDHNHGHIKELSCPEVASDPSFWE